MLLHVLLSGFIKLLWFYLMELHYKVVTLGTQIIFKGTNNQVMVQGPFLYIFILVLAVFIKVDDLSTLLTFDTRLILTSRGYMLGFIPFHIPFLLGLLVDGSFLCVFY